MILQNPDNSAQTNTHYQRKHKKQQEQRAREGEKGGGRNESKGVLSGYLTRNRSHREESSK